MFLQTSLNWGPNFSPPNYTSWVNLVRQNAGHRDQHIVAIHPFLLWNPSKTPPILCPNLGPWKKKLRLVLRINLPLTWWFPISDEGWNIATSLEANQRTPSEGLARQHNASRGFDVRAGKPAFWVLLHSEPFIFHIALWNQKKTQQKMQESAIESIPTNLQHLHVQQLVTQAYPGIPWCLHSKMDTGLLA